MAGSLRLLHSKGLCSPVTPSECNKLAKMMSSEVSVAVIEGRSMLRAVDEVDRTDSS